MALFECTTRDVCSIASTSNVYQYWQLLRIYHKCTVRPDYYDCSARIPRLFTHTRHGKTDTFLLQKQLVSLVVCETGDSSQTPGDKKVAYLVDATTARVDCLVSGVASLRGVSERSDAHPNSTNSQSSLTVPHAHKIDWLELNARGTYLLFRGKKWRLFLRCSGMN